MNKYISLMTSFLKLGTFTFGGGYAMIPLIEKDIVEKKKMITTNEMTDIIAVSESTPGPLAINCATFVGFKVGGFLGATISTLSVVFPSFIIILILSFFLQEFLALEYVAYAFYGIRLAVSIMVLEAGIKMAYKAQKNLLFYILALISLFISIFFTHISPSLIILVGGLVGMICTLMGYKGEEKWFI